jgi:hypothetical protein
MVISGFNGNVSDLGNYSASSGLTDLKLNSDFTSYWAADNAKVFEQPFSTSPNVPDYQGDLLASNPVSGDSDAWTFITAPQSVSYSVSASVQRVDIFGTNEAPIIASSRGMRDLTLTDALMEGFTLGKSIQKNLDDLENLMNVEVDSKNGFVNVPIYSVYAGGKTYGKYIIEQVDIDEQMRDTQGKATRAMVGVTFKQVPEYQVGTGVDQAGASTGGQALDASKINTSTDKQASKIKKDGKTTTASTAATNAANKAGDGTNTNPSPDLRSRDAPSRTSIVRNP